MKTRFELGLALAVAFLGACGAKDDSKAKDGAAPPLRVGIEAAYPPFESVTATGEFEGFDVDLARAVAEALGRTAEFHNAAFDSLPKELDADRIDVICSGMSYTDERAKSYDFTKPYAQSPMSVLVNTTLAKDVTKLAQLDDPKIKVAVQRGTTGETKARAAFPKATFMLYDTEADAAREVSTGRLHAFVYDFLSVEKFAKQSPDTTRVLDEDLGSERYCIAAKKGSPLTAKIDAFLAVATKPGGKIDELMKKWGLAPEKWRTTTK